MAVRAQSRVVPGAVLQNEKYTSSTLSSSCSTRFTTAARARVLPDIAALSFVSQPSAFTRQAGERMERFTLAS
jgi:hypothetical protein